LGLIFTSEIANGSGVLIDCRGDLDVKELCEEMRTLHERFPAIASWCFAILDLSVIGHLQVEAAHFDALVQQHRQLSQVTRPGLCVAVIARTDLAFGVSRMWQVASEPTGWVTSIFRERRAAEAWLRHCVLSNHALELPHLWPESSGASA
jgi:hypothetical protein